MIAEASPETSILLFQVVGVPSALTYTCCALVRALATAAAGNHAFIHAVSLEDLKSAWVQLDKSTASLVVFSDCPSSKLLGLLGKTRAPSLAILEDFEETVNDLIETRDMAAAQAVRLASQVYSLLDVDREGAILRVTRSDRDRSLHDFLCRIGEHFGLQRPEKLAEAVLLVLGYSAQAESTLQDHLVGAGRLIVSRTSKATDIIARDRGVIEFLARQYQDVGTGFKTEHIEWPCELFLDCDRAGAFLLDALELVGPARYLVYGPYLHLPADRWVVEIVFEITDNMSGNRLWVDVCSGTILAQVTMSLPPSGVFGFSIPFEVVDSFLPLEVRFKLLEGAIEGRLHLRRVLFHRGGH